MTKKDKKFIEYVQQRCAETGVVCDLDFEATYIHMSDVIKCSGYFDDCHTPRLVVAMNRPDAMGILAHEYAHLTQWEEGLPLWNFSAEALAIVDDWLGGDNTHDKDIQYYLGLGRDLELENEKRTATIIANHGLSINLDDYVKKANAYIHFYNYMFFSRRWSTPENPPYLNKSIVRLMSSEFDMNYHTLEPKLFKAYLKGRIGL